MVRSISLLLPVGAALVLSVHQQKVEAQSPFDVLSTAIVELSRVITVPFEVLPGLISGGRRPFQADESRRQYPSAPANEPKRVDQYSVKEAERTKEVQQQEEQQQQEQQEEEQQQQQQQQQQQEEGEQQQQQVSEAEEAEESLAAQEIIEAAGEATEAEEEQQQQQQQQQQEEQQTEKEAAAAATATTEEETEEETAFL
ncbi:hypothetical protein, conserved, partial [Eimeria acervulina]